MMLSENIFDSYRECFCFVLFGCFVCLFIYYALYCIVSLENKIANASKVTNNIPFFSGTHTSLMFICSFNSKLTNYTLSL